MRARGEKGGTEKGRTKVDAHGDEALHAEQVDLLADRERPGDREEDGGHSEPREGEEGGTTPVG